jgi:hypothetical protein
VAHLPFVHNVIGFQRICGVPGQRHNNFSNKSVTDSAGEDHGLQFGYSAYFSGLRVAGGLVIIIPFGWILYALFFHPLARIPGPFLARVSEIWKLQRAIKGTLHRDLLTGHQKYGRVFRIAPNEVSIADPESIKVIYALNSGFNKVSKFLSSR